MKKIFSHTVCFERKLAAFSIIWLLSNISYWKTSEKNMKNISTECIQGLI